MSIYFLVKINNRNINGPTFSVTNLVKELKEIYKEKVFVITTDTAILEDISVNTVQVKPFIYFKENFKKNDTVIVNGVFELCYFKAVLYSFIRNANAIISPRSSLMKASLMKGTLKKVVYLLPFISISKLAKTKLHFLTEEEKRNSFNFGFSSFIAPNGYHTSNIKKMDKEKLISYMGRYDIAHKGLDVFMSSIKQTSNHLRKSGWRVKLAGTNYRNGRVELTKLVDSYGIGDIVEIVGPVRDKEKSIFLSKSSIFIHSSRYEGLPLSVLEAISHANYIIVSKFCNIDSIVSKYNVGSVLERLDSDCLANKIKEITDNYIVINDVDISKFHNDYTWKNAAIAFKENGLENESKK